MAHNVQRFMTPRSRAKHGAGVSGAFPKLRVLVPAPVDAPAGAALHEPSRLCAVFSRACFTTCPTSAHSPAERRSESTAMLPALHPETACLVVPILLRIRVPHDYPALAHMQGSQRGVPVVSIPEAKPPGLILDKKGRVLLHPPESGPQRRETSLPTGPSARDIASPAPGHTCVPASRARCEAGPARIAATTPDLARTLRSCPDRSGSGEPGLPGHRSLPRFAPMPGRRSSTPHYRRLPRTECHHSSHDLD